MSAPAKIPISRETARFVQPEAPREAKLMAARGTLPLGPSELVTVLFLLSRDADPEILETALASVASLPMEQVHRAIEQGLAPPLLDFLARRRKDDPSLVERIALDPSTPDATIAYLATLPYKGIVEIISNNQARILRSPPIVEALGDNPLTGRAAIDRILSFLGLEGKLKRIAPEPGNTPEVPPEVPSIARADTKNAVPSVARADSGNAVPSIARTDSGNAVPSIARADSGNAARADAQNAGACAEEVPSESAEAPAGDRTDDLPEDLVKTAEEAPNQSNIDKHNLMQMIQALTVFQRIRLARLGNKEARGLLVRDRNKIVATAAIRSPKITDTEVIAYARSRSVNDEIPRIIAMEREWTKIYQVQISLVSNPKTPLIYSLKFVNYLQEGDLRALAKSRDIPRQVVAAARRLLTRKKGDQ